MTDIDASADPPGQSIRRVRLVELGVPALAALAHGDLAAAGAAAGIDLGTYFLGETWWWGLRRSQLADDPDRAGWLAHAAVDADAEGPDTAVGFASFHGPPDDHGMVEIGYAVAPEFRRRGYAKGIVAALIARAATAPEVTTVRAAISPDNPASLAVIAGFGFEHVGQQWEKADGLEYLYERPVVLPPGRTGR
ncbi:GNAT family N-acetyltransferase [Nocardiopsis sp. NRRL B-16309]|uniref:GNAT family N-acetyltransferase n=1 Tax=Nocardiopsis sp. NRRL B-16309 TaxID=1519494 RepID=UPI0006AD8DA5|nr:GNAT family N-acetyltransferase [Nocardiopsis sp. NRRL B-16309]KOX13939.1 acetyltransferase [Nocardiopsis sp. NRRL B-16309]